MNNPSNQPELDRYDPEYAYTGDYQPKQKGVGQTVPLLADAQAEVGLREKVINVLSDSKPSPFPGDGPIKRCRVSQKHVDKVMALFQADKSAAVVKAENAARLAEQANTRADTPENVAARLAIELIKQNIITPNQRERHD